MAVERQTDTYWRATKSLPKGMSNMLENEINCDVTFKVGGEKKPIKAHKCVLSSRSPVFRTMFVCSLPEIKEISISDVDESNFRTFLRYIYTDEVPSISNDNVKEMMSLSYTYIIPRIKECKKYLRKTAGTTDAAQTLQIAYTYSLDSLINQSLFVIEENPIQCLSSDYALDLSIDCLELILKSDLKCSQNDLAPFLLKWSQNKCELAKVEANTENMRKMAGHLMYLIADPEKDIRTGLLNFVFKQREPVIIRDKIEAWRVLSNVQYCYAEAKGVEALQFETTKDIWLKGVYIGNISPTNFGCTICLKVLDSYYKNLHSFEHYFTYSLNMFSSFMFPKPVKISKYTKYTIILEGLLLASIYSLNCENPVSVCGVTFMFEKSPLCTGCTDEKKGQFPALIFSI